MVVRLPWHVESIAPDPDGLAATVARGHDVWLVGRESGAVTLDVRGASDAQRAILAVSVDLRAPVEDAGPGTDARPADGDPRTKSAGTARSDDPDCTARNGKARCRRDPTRTECKAPGRKRAA